MKYDRQISPEEIAEGSYKQMLGGGADLWQERGAAQLAFLCQIGLTPQSHLLDIGCGPLRAGEHLIRFLDPGHYTGIDYNASFIDAARWLVQKSDLADKEPRLAHVLSFKAANLAANYDFGVAFSVLNHCDLQGKKAFFTNIPTAFLKPATLFITHARWYRPDEFPAPRFTLEQVIGNADSGVFDAAWPELDRNTLFPILRFSVQPEQDPRFVDSHHVS